MDLSGRPVFVFESGAGSGAKAPLAVHSRPVDLMGQAAYGTPLSDVRGRQAWLRLTGEVGPHQLPALALGAMHRFLLSELRRRRPGGILPLVVSPDRLRLG